MNTQNLPRRILVIEDESAIADAIVYALRTENFEPDWHMTGTEGLRAFAERRHALVILDVGLPDGSGFDVCREIRRQGNVPVLFLTARSEEVDRVVGLELGADDYMVKPFSPRELVARVRAILRRTSATAETPAKTGATGGFTLDEVRQRISYRGQALDLSRYEYRLLKVLLGQPGRVFSREQLLQQAWEHPEHSLDRTIDTHIKALRAKIHAIAPADNPIRTHRGVGYSMDDGA